MVIQKWVLRGYDTRGEDTTFSKISAFLVSIAPLNATTFLNYTLLNNTISGTLCFWNYKKGGEIKEERARGKRDTFGTFCGLRRDGQDR